MPTPPAGSGASISNAEDSSDTRITDLRASTSGHHAGDHPTLTVSAAFLAGALAKNATIDPNTIIASRFSLNDTAVKRGLRAADSGTTTYSITKKITTP